LLKKFTYIFMRRVVLLLHIARVPPPAYFLPSFCLPQTLPLARLHLPLLLLLFVRCFIQDTVILSLVSSLPGVATPHSEKARRVFCVPQFTQVLPANRSCESHTTVRVFSETSVTSSAFQPPHRRPRVC